MDIATLMRDGRDRAALTQSELAHRAGVSQSMVSAIERGSRQPSSSVVARILSELGLELRSTTGPAAESEAELDAAIDRALSTPAAARLMGAWFDGPTVLALLTPLEPVVEGVAGAVLHGAPLPVSAVDVSIHRDRLGDLARIVEKSYAERWSEVWGKWGMESASPNAPGPFRWRTLEGEFRVRLVDEQPEAVTVLVNDLSVAVRPLHEIETTEPRVRRALARLRCRLADP